jgi:hypothetical protein
MRVGLALAAEEAGNPVERLTLAEVAGELRACGFDVVVAERYAMLYRHQPGLPSRVLSTPALLPMARGALTLFNGLAGRIGNKLALQAVRSHQ